MCYRFFVSAIVAGLLCSAFGEKAKRQWFNPEYSEQEVAAFEKRANAGNAQAAYFYSIALCNGYGVVKDEGRAYAFARDAMLSGFRPALYLMGLCYLEGRGVEKNPEEAHKWFSRFTTWARALDAKKTNPVVMHSLAWCYASGNGVGKSSERAFSLYLKAAQQGHYLSQFKVGKCYLKGEGVDADIEKGLQIIKSVAGKGFPLAQQALGEMYLDGKDGSIPVDREKGLKLLESAANQGRLQAQMALGLRYATGDGVPKDFILAKKWLSMASAKGDKEADHLLDSVANMENLQEQISALISLSNALATVGQDPSLLRRLYVDQKNGVNTRQDCVAAPEKAVANVLESFLGVKFGNANISVESRAGKDLFVPSRKFRSFDEYWVSRMPLSHKVFSIAAVTPKFKLPDAYDEFEIVAGLLERKYACKLERRMEMDDGSSPFSLAGIVCGHRTSSDDARSITVFLAVCRDGRLKMEVTREDLERESRKERRRSVEKKVDAAASDGEIL